jgi:hypothetical protein
MIVQTVDSLRCVLGRVCALSPSSLATLAGAILIAAASSQAVAAPINYGDFMGTTVTYVGVTEDSNSGDTPPLFGAPTISGDSLDFDPVGFSASAKGEDGVDITDGNLKFMVVAKPGNTISGIVLSEAGDTTLAGFGTDETFTAVLGQGILKVSQVNGVPINVISTPFTMSFSPSGGTYGLATDGGGGPLYSTGWSGGVTLDVDAFLASKNIAGKATKITINLDNTLVALSELGTESLIAKKDFGGVSITVIPEPSTCVLIGLAAIGLACSRRKS